MSYIEEARCLKVNHPLGVNNLVMHNGYTQAVSGPTRGDALLDIYLLRPEMSLISCNTWPGICDHNGVLLEIEGD